MMSVVIPYREGSAIRTENLKETIKCLKKQTFQDFEIILVEENSNTIERFDVDKHIHIKSDDGIWNEGWAYNVGARQSSGDRLMFLGGDYLFDENYLLSMNNCKLKGFLGWKTCYSLNQEGRQAYLSGIGFKGLQQDKYVWRKKESSWDCSAGGSLVFNKDYFWNEIGGFNENIFGWGKLDNEIAARMFYSLKNFYVLDNTIYHLWHSKETDMRVYDRSMRTLEATIKNPALMIERLKKVRLGNINKPTLVEV